MRILILSASVGAGHVRAAEGVELALILRAVELSTEGLQTWIGTLVGIAAAIAVGVFFFKGTLRVPHGRSNLPDGT